MTTPVEALPVGTPVVHEGHIYHTAEPSPLHWAPRRDRFLIPLVRPEGQTKGATPGKEVLCNAGDLRLAEGADELTALIREEVAVLVKAELAVGRGLSAQRRKEIAQLAAEAMRQKFTGLTGRFAYLPGRVLPSVPESVKGNDAQVCRQLGALLNPRGV